MTPQLSHTMIQERIATELSSRSKAEYNLGKQKAEVTRLEAIIELHNQTIAGLEQARSVMADMEAQLTQAVAGAAAKVATPPLPVDGPPAHITQPVKPPVTRAGPKRQAAGKKTGRPPGRPKGSGAKKAPDAIHNEATVPGGNAKMNGGMTPGQAVEMGL